MFNTKTNETTGSGEKLVKVTHTCLFIFSIAKLISFVSFSLLLKELGIKVCRFLWAITQLPFWLLYLALQSIG